MLRKIILALALLSSVSAPAAILMADNFNYTNGVLTVVSGGFWFAHSAQGIQPVMVTNGAIQIGANDPAEDVSAPLAGSPYTSVVATNNASLYASFYLRQTSLPASGGTYLAHFRDPAFIYPARIFVSTANAPSNQFRVSIANSTSGGNSAQLTTNLVLNSNYLVVSRLALSNGACTVWVNPASETDTNITATDSRGAATINSYAFRQSGGEGVCLIDNVRVGTTFAEVVSPNNPPSISKIPAQGIPPNTSAGPIRFAVSDAETPDSNLLVIATSSNPTLLPNAGILLDGSGTNSTITLTPASGQSGSTIVTVSVTDAGGTTTITTFNLFVGVPGISCFPPLEIPIGTNSGPIPFSVSDIAQSPSNLVVTATAANTNLLPSSSFVFGGGGAVRSLTITPVATNTGETTVTVVVSDGVLSDSVNFTVTVYPVFGSLVNEPFTYPDNTPITGGTTPWTNASGVAGETLVVGGKLLLNETNTESFYRVLPGATIATTNGGIVFASLRVNFSALPAFLRGAFANFGTGGSSIGYLSTHTRRAAQGKFRMAVTSLTSDPNYEAEFPEDLDLNTDHLAVVSCNPGTGAIRLWLDPLSDLSPSVVTPPGYFQPTTVRAFEFGQGTGIGALTVDDLKIGTAFTDVVTNLAGDFPQVFIAARCDGGLEINWQAALTNYVLEQTPDLPGAWQTYPNQGLVLGQHKDLVIYDSTGNGFFRLRKQ